MLDLTDFPGQARAHPQVRVRNVHNVPMTWKMNRGSAWGVLWSKRSLSLAPRRLPLTHPLPPQPLAPLPDQLGKNAAQYTGSRKYTVKWCSIKKYNQKEQIK